LRLQIVFGETFQKAFHLERSGLTDTNTYLCASMLLCAYVVKSLRCLKFATSDEFLRKFSDVGNIIWSLYLHDYAL